MKHSTSTLMAGLVGATFVIASAPLASTAHAAPTPDHSPERATTPDDLPHPLGDRQRALRTAAVDKLIKGQARTVTKNGQRVIEMKGRFGKPKYVQYGVNREAAIFTILTDFGSNKDPRYGGTPGPQHNQIPQPDRTWDGNATDDNSTLWKSDFNRAHFQSLMFGDGVESLKDFYRKQSNGRFLAKGDVSDWVTVPFNEARYGAKNDSDGYWNYVKDTASAWYKAQVAAGKSLAQIKAYLSQFDKADRYDYDGDGNFAEPDGYIDHFQAIHAGVGEEAGGGAQGTDAIWSHRWYAFADAIGKSGPSQNPAGGVPLGDSGLWIGDYTTEPENGGLGVFAHEFGHDLGLPDLYDTRGGDNGTGFWTLMSGGSWLSHSAENIGSSPGYMGAWEKFQLGWLDAKVINYGKQTSTTLGPADRTDPKLGQALIVNLPDKTITDSYNTPHSGRAEWWSGTGDNLKTTLTRSIDLTRASSGSVSAWLANDLETGYDNLFAEASTDGGATWERVGDPVTGTELTWHQKTWDLSRYAGKKIDFRWNHVTDGGNHLKGAFLDDITITVGAVASTDDVESGDHGWTASGFTRMNGSVTRAVPHQYYAENRVYGGYDKNLRTGAYNFGWRNTKPNWVERFPYQNGLLISYADGQYADNNTSQHPGGGQILQVDARPRPIVFPDGTLLGNRRQPFDATFGNEATEAVTFHSNGTPVTVPSQPAIATFDDRVIDRYWSAQNPQNSTKVAGSGTSIRVQFSAGDLMRVNVSFTRRAPSAQ